MKGLIRHDEGELNDALFEPIVALYEILGPLSSEQQLHPILVFIADAIVSNLRSRVRILAFICGTAELLI